MSWAQLLSPGIRQEPIEGGYNILEGLREWRLGTVYAKGRRDLAGSGGVDVVVLGDSIFAGAGSNFIYVDGVMNRLRQSLQRRFNPNDIAGGYGFVPFVTVPPTPSFVGNTFMTGNMLVNGADTDWAFYGLAAAFTGETGDSKGITLRHARTASALSGQTAAWMNLNSMRINHGFQVSTSAQNATAKQAQIVYQTNAGWGRFQWIHGPFTGGNPYAGTPPSPPANSFSETIDAAAAEAVGLRSALSDVATTTAATHYVQIDQLDADQDIAIEGILHYVDDFDTGVRVHNLSCGGALSGSWNDAVTLAGLARFGSRAGTIPGQNAQNAKLVVIQLGTNDNGDLASPNVDIPTYTANLATLIQSVQAWPSKPSILLAYPPVRNDAEALSRWGDYIAAGRALAETYNVALLDLWAAAGSPTHGGNGAGGFWFDRGMYADGVHYNEKAQDWFAEMLYGALTVGI